MTRYEDYRVHEVYEQVAIVPGHAPVSTSAVKRTFLLIMCNRFEQDTVGGGCEGSEGAAVPPLAASFSFPHREMILAAFGQTASVNVTGILQVRGFGLHGCDIKGKLNAVGY